MDPVDPDPDSDPDLEHCLSVHTEWRWPISGRPVHPYNVKISPGWGVHAQSPTPFQPRTITYKVAVYAPAERADKSLPTLYVLCDSTNRTVFLVPETSVADPDPHSLTYRS